MKSSTADFTNNNPLKRFNLNAKIFTGGQLVSSPLHPLGTTGFASPLSTQFGVMPENYTLGLVKPTIKYRRVTRFRKWN